MAVKIRMKMMGRRHRPFFRICVTDVRTPRDGRVLEEVGYYDPMVPETDARAVLNSERINHWIGVGAKPSDRVAVLIKKYGTNGTHLEAQNAAVERLNKIRRRPVITIRPIISDSNPNSDSEQTEQSQKSPDKKIKSKSKPKTKVNKEQTNNDTV
ncbi:MAG: 30S ribosomal protein S16 [Planctomycetaceae bacterium]|jgi:small subunit ribosomal protein S16|nr:30S ribosomal protein S16 [Planctomycetaceae bacterium]